MATLEQLIANVTKIRGFIAVYLDLPTLNAKQAEALRIDLRQLDKNLAALDAYEAPVAVAVLAPPVADHVLTYDEEHVIFIAADDEVLKSLGRPYGHDGAERGALPLQTHIEMAEKLNLPLHVAEFKSFIVPGASQ